MLFGFNGGDVLSEKILQWLQQAGPATLAAVLRYMPCLYGVRRIEHDPDALDSGVFVVQRLDVLLPDGTVMKHPENTAGDPLEIDLNDALAASPDGVEVSLVIPRVRHGSPNATREGEKPSQPTRFEARRREVADFNDGEGTDLVDLLLLKPVLGANVTANPATTTLPLVRVRKVGSQIRLDDGFSPPAVRIGDAPHLLALLKGLTARLADRAAKLRDLVPHPDTHELTPESLLAQQLLRIADCARETVSASTGPGHRHPHDVWVDLRKLHGELKAFRPLTKVARKLAEYDHARPATAFRDVIRGIGNSLDVLVPKRARSFEFVRMPMRTCNVCSAPAGSSTICPECEALLRDGDGRDLAYTFEPLHPVVVGVTEADLSTSQSGLPRDRVASGCDPGRRGGGARAHQARAAEGGSGRAGARRRWAHARASPRASRSRSVEAGRGVVRGSQDRRHGGAPPDVGRRWPLEPARSRDDGIRDASSASSLRVPARDRIAGFTRGYPAGRGGLAVTTKEALNERGKVNVARFSVVPVLNLVHAFRSMEQVRWRHDADDEVAELGFEEYRNNARRLIDEFQQATEDAGVEPHGVTWMSEILVAFIDEEVARSSWQHAKTWTGHPLQKELFKTHLLGEKCVRNLEERGMRSMPEVLEIYALCLASGYRGRLAADAGNWSAKTRQCISRADHLTSERTPGPLVPIPEGAFGEEEDIPRAWTRGRRMVVIGAILLAVFTAWLTTTIVSWRAESAEAEISEDRGD